MDTMFIAFFFGIFPRPGRMLPGSSEVLFRNEPSLTRRALAREFYLQFPSRVCYFYSR